MDNIGTILKLKEKQAIVMTMQSDFVIIKRRPGMEVGQEVRFRKSEQKNGKSSIMKFSGLLASAAAIVMVAFLYFRIAYFNNVFAYIDVDINPSVEFAIDKEKIVIDVNPLSEDAKAFIDGLELENVPFDVALSEILKKAKSSGMINKDTNNVVLISASLDDSVKDGGNNAQTDDSKLNGILDSSKEVVSVVTDKEVEPKVIKLTPESRKMALENSVSMGKIAIYAMIKANGNDDISLEEVKNSRVSTIIEKAQLKLPGEKEDEEILVLDIKPSEKTGTVDGQDKNNKDSQESQPMVVMKTEPVPTPVEPDTGLITPIILNKNEPTKQPIFPVLNNTPSNTKLSVFTPLPVVNTPLPVMTANLANVSTPAVLIKPTEAIFPSAIPVISPTKVPTTKAKGVPGNPILNSDQYEGDYDSTYTVFMHMWWGNNAIQWRLYENDKLVYTEDLEDDTPHTQSASSSFANKPSGTYIYKCELINSYGTMTSAPITILVLQNSVPSSQVSPTDVVHTNTPIDTPISTPTFTPVPTVGRPTNTPVPSDKIETPVPSPEQKLDLTPRPQQTPVTGPAEWRPDIHYNVGDVVSYSGLEYVCLISHSSITSWTPEDAPSLWVKR